MNIPFSGYPATHLSFPDDNLLHGASTLPTPFPQVLGILIGTGGAMFTALYGAQGSGGTDRNDMLGNVCFLLNCLGTR